MCGGDDYDTHNTYTILHLYTTPHLTTTTLQPHYNHTIDIAQLKWGADQKTMLEREQLSASRAVGSYMSNVEVRYEEDMRIFDRYRDQAKVTAKSSSRRGRKPKNSKKNDDEYERSTELKLLGPDDNSPYLAALGECYC